MKIRSKIALRYSGITALLMMIFAAVIYLMSSRDREKEFYDDLRKEGISKASLIIEGKASPDIMHSIYKNNIEFIDEVEVAIYTMQDSLLYHDAKDIDIVKETPELLYRIKSNAKNGIRFFEGKYQAIGFLFRYDNINYVVTAAAYDGYGYAKLRNLSISLLLLCSISVAISFIIGYYLAKRALRPVKKISDRMKDITANNLDLRLLKYNENDEFGELADSFNKALDIIESSFESQKMFVSNVSHELRTPLAALVGEIDLALLKDRSVDEYKKTLNNSQQDAQKLIRLLNDLLDLAKASYEESKISMTKVRIDEILLDARELILKAKPDYNINLQFLQTVDDSGFVTVKGNAYLLKIAFANLMENNCKFSDDMTSSVRISLVDKKIVLFFSDNGIGIPKDELQRIFIPFFRGQNKQYSQGNGIGLALVKKVITLHKGTIDVYSVVGEGTNFKIELQPI